MMLPMGTIRFDVGSTVTRANATKKNSGAFRRRRRTAITLAPITSARGTTTSRSSRGDRRHDTKGELVVGVVTREGPWPGETMQRSAEHLEGREPRRPEVGARQWIVDEGNPGQLDRAQRQIPHDEPRENGYRQQAVLGRQPSRPAQPRGLPRGRCEIE